MSALQRRRREDSNRSTLVLFFDTLLGRFILFSTVVGILFGAIVYLESIRSTAQEAVRIASEAKTEVKETKDSLSNKADKQDVKELGNKIDNFRYEWFMSQTSPDIITRYKYVKPKSKK